MSTYWIHSSGTVAVDDAVMKGVDVSGFPSNLQLMMWYGSYGELRYKDDDRLPIRERVANLAAFVHIFDRWILAANTPLPTESGRASPPIITLAQAQFVKGQLVWGLYYNKSQPVTPGAAPPDNTASVNAAVQGLADSTNAAIDSMNSIITNLAAQTTNAMEGYAQSNTGARSADAQALNASLDGQHAGHTANIAIVNQNFVTVQNAGSVPMGNVTSPQGGISPVVMQTTHVDAASVAPLSAVPPVSTSPVLPGGAAGPHDTLAPIRDAHLGNVYAQSSVEGVAAYDITAGW